MNLKHFLKFTMWVQNVDLLTYALQDTRYKRLLGQSAPAFCRASRLGYLIKVQSESPHGGVGLRRMTLDQLPAVSRLFDKKRKAKAHSGLRRMTLHHMRGRYVMSVRICQHPLRRVAAYAGTGG